MWGKKKPEEKREIPERQKHETAAEYLRRVTASKGIAVPAVTAAIEEDPNVPCESCKHLINKDKAIQVDVLRQTYGLYTPAWNHEILYFESGCWSELFGFEPIFNVVRVWDSFEYIGLFMSKVPRPDPTVRYFMLDTNILSGLDGKVYSEVEFTLVPVPVSDEPDDEPNNKLEDDWFWV